MRTIYIRKQTLTARLFTLITTGLAGFDSTLLTVNKSTGKVTVRMGAKKGAYAIKTKIVAAGNGKLQVGQQDHYLQDCGQLEIGATDLVEEGWRTVIKEGSDMRRETRVTTEGMWAALKLLLLLALSFACFPSLAFSEAIDSDGRSDQVLEAVDSDEYAETAVESEEEAVSEPRLLTQSSIVASGTCGTCPWSLDTEGVLTISTGELLSYVDYQGENSFWPWYGHAMDINKVIFSGNVIAGNSTGYMFSDYTNLVEVDIEGLDTSNTTSMERMFSGCTSLANLDLRKIDMSAVTNAEGMFNSTALSFDDISTLNMSHLVNGSYMFVYCNVGDTLDLRGMDLSNLTHANYMFAGCSAKKALMGNIYAPVLGNTMAMFKNCKNLVSIDMSGMIVGSRGNGSSSKISCSDMFSGCSNLEEVKLPNFNCEILDFSNLLRNCTSIQSLDLSNIQNDSYISLYGLFENCTSLQTYSFPKMGDVKVSDLGSTFAGCTNLRSVDLSLLDTSQTNVIGNTFGNCARLESVDLSTLDTSSVWYTEEPKLHGVGWSNMFPGCVSLKEIKLSGKIDFNGDETTYLPTVEVNGHTDWYSKKDGVWYTSKQIAENRASIADTYVKEAVAKSLSSCTVTLSQASYTYDGTQKSPTVTVKDGSTVLTAGTHYTLTTPAGRTNAGTYTYTVTGKGNYTGTKTASFTISQAAPTLSFASSSVSKKTTDPAFTNALTKTTDGTVTFSSSNTSVATVNSSTGQVTVKGAGTATITASAAAGTNYKAGSASYTLTVTYVSKTFTYGDLTYSFTNGAWEFGYPENYIIPLESYKLVFGNVKAQKLYQDALRTNDTWGGSCYGMASTAAMFNVGGSGFIRGRFRTSAASNKDLRVSDSWNGHILTRYIEALQVSQAASERGDAQWHNSSKYLGLARALRGVAGAVSEASASGRPPLVVYFWPNSLGRYSGHAVTGLSIQNANSTTDRLMIYDPNFPNTSRYITLSKNSSGAYTGWYYKHNDSRNTGSSYGDCWISFIPYSVYQGIWANGSSVKATNTLITSSRDFTLADVEGNVLATVEGGMLTASEGSVHQDVWAQENENPDASTMISIPSDVVYTLRAADGAGQLNATMINESQAATVVTDASEVTFAVNDDEETNIVDVAAGDGETYSVTLDSDLASAESMENIELSGIGAGDTVTVGTVGGECVVANGRSATMTVNGQAVALGGRADITKPECAIEYTSCVYDGKAHEPKVTVTHGGATLAEDRDFVVKYAGNVGPGAATATVYGIGGYGGRVELKFRIGRVQTITASNKEVATGKSVKLGAKASGGGKLTYKSSNTNVVTVTSAGVVKGVKAGTVKITIKAAATGNYLAATKTVTVKVGKANPLAAKAKAKSVVAPLKTVSKKAVALASNVTITKKGQGAVTYANASANTTAKKFKVAAKTGKITVPKGTNKGTYVVKVKVTAKGNKAYISGTKTISYKVVVK